MAVTARIPGATGSRRAPRSSSAYLRTHGRLLLRVTRNEIRARYAASVLGPAWVFLGPVLLLGLYGVVYRAIFDVRAPGLGSTEYVLYIFAGLVAFLMTAEALTVSATSVVRTTSAVGNTVFPIDLAPVKAVLATLPTMAVGGLIVLVGAAATGNLHWTVLLAPLVVLLHVVALVGVAWLAAPVTVVFRDLEHLLTAIILVLLVVSPIAYTPEMVPESLKLLLYLNPLAYFVIAYQKLLVLGELPTLLEAGVVVGLSLGLFLLGSRFFPWAKRVTLDYV